MEAVELMFVLLMVFLCIYAWIEVNPKIDFNAVTGHYLLWYNDPFDCYERKAITLWKKT
jgi:hypothetical protein